MIARVVSLRALVVEDIALTAERAHRPAAALLLRRLPDDAQALTAVGDELRIAATGTARVAGGAAGYLSQGLLRAAVADLADHCGLSVEDWIAATCEEQGVELEAVA